MANTKPVYSVTKIGDRTYKNQVGVAFEPNQDGTMNVQLTSVPLSGKLQIGKKETDHE